MPEAILIVDDDPVQRRLLEAMTGRFGYQALTADGGDAALTLLCGPEAPRIDCVILDLVMPDLDGLGVLAKMRERGLRIPVIVQTAHGGVDNVVSAMRAGAADFVVIAGRRPPESAWFEGGWETLSVEIELAPLSECESHELLSAYGADDETRTQSIVAW